ncbi:MAG: hypothetical protein RLY86_3731 [Pseudomonadota bacterium]
MTVDPRAFRDAMGCFATGICVATTHGAGGRPVGVTVNSFTSVSLDPPLVLFCLDKGAESHAAFSACTGFALTVLGEGQQAVSSAFAGRPDGERWPLVRTDRWDSGAPVIQDGLAAMDCALHAIHDGGDHAIIVGRILRLESRVDGAPLLYFRGRYRTMPA